MGSGCAKSVASTRRAWRAHLADAEAIIKAEMTNKSFILAKGERRKVSVCYPSRPSRERTRLSAASFARQREKGKGEEEGSDDCSDCEANYRQKAELKPEECLAE